MQPCAYAEKTAEGDDYVFHLPGLTIDRQVPDMTYKPAVFVEYGCVFNPAGQDQLAIFCHEFAP
jgi:hypothetical protein